MFETALYKARYDRNSITLKSVGNLHVVVQPGLQSKTLSQKKKIIEKMCLRFSTIFIIVSYNFSSFLPHCKYKT